MKPLFLCVILTMTIGTSIAIVCPKDICISTSCSGPMTEADCKRGQIFVPNGGFCGCCNSCVEALKYGQACNQFRGSPPTTMCEPPTVCKTTDSSSTPICTYPASPPFVPPNYQPPTEDPSSEDCQASAFAYAD